MQNKEDYSSWVLNLPFWLIVVTVVISISWVLNIRSIEEHALSLARERGQYTFKIIEATRLWMAQHGVAYVVRSETTPSNPWLEIDERDISTPSGRMLTAVNPAYMTRQLSGVLARNHELFIHLTSDKPLNPNNKPDEWEAGAISEFNRGAEDVIEVIDRDGDQLVRYMAPLFVKKPCLRCHEKQGYSEGDVRGGISVSFSYEPFISSTAQQRQNIHAVHIVAWVILTMLATFTIKLVRRHQLALERSRDDAESLVEQRTQELRDEISIRRSAEVKLQLLINNTEEGIFGIDEQGRISFMNSAGMNMLGYTAVSSIVGHEVNDVLRLTNSDGTPVDTSECQITAAWKEGKSGHSEDELIRREDGTSLAIEYHVHPLFAENRVVGAVANFSDISLRKALQESLWRQANFDSLTGIPNRALLFDRLKYAIEQSRRGHFRLAVLYIDLNLFKPVNDQYGHEAGDEVLRAVAQRLSAHVRDSDTVARIGGDEFIVLLNQVDDRMTVEKIARKFSEEIHKPINIGAADVEVGVSIGISIFPDDADNMDLLLAKADQAMYKEKDGR